MANFNRYSSRFQRAAYALFRRVGVADHSLVFCGNTTRIAESSQSDLNRFNFGVLSQGEIASLTECNPDFKRDAFRTLDLTRFRCFTLTEDKQVAAYAWVGLDDIPASHNSNGHEWTGLPIYLDAETAYLFAAFVAPANRGQRLYQILLSKVASTVLGKGINRIALTTDLTNSSAIKAVPRMGFVFYGETQFTAFAGWRRSKYNVSSEFLPSRFGKYTGDRCAK